MKLRGGTALQTITTPGKAWDDQAILQNHHQRTPQQGRIRSGRGGDYESLSALLRAGARQRAPVEVALHDLQGFAK